jgi:hypothetical protein
MKLTQKDFADSFGVNEFDIPTKTKALISKLDFQIAEIIGKERDELIVQVVDKIRRDEQVIASPVRKEIWQKGWAENLQLYIDSEGAQSTLIPKFIRSGLPIRWFGKYFEPNDKNFELNYITVLREFLFEVYFKSVSCLYEFGAGTGFNLLHASQSLPGVKLVGTDFVPSAVELMNRVGSDFSIPLSSCVFDMMNPGDAGLKINPNSGVLTFGSLEQLGGNLLPMIEYLCQQRPKICVHIEPAVELYDPECLEDYLAIWFQAKRGYSSGLIALLQDYQSKGVVSIKKIQRLNFGSLMMEGYNLIAWEPV